jgi:aspartate dehydrogenase
MPFSVTAFADEGSEAAMLEAAQINRHRLIVPHGGAVALKQLHDERDRWEKVVITMDKDVRSIDFSESGLETPAPGHDPVVVFDGPTRVIAGLFPRNVNTHAAIALAGIGFDRTRSILRASRGTGQSRLSVVATGPEVELRVDRVASISGVSGASTFSSMVQSVIAAAPERGGVVFG